VDSYERLTILILDGLNQVLCRSDSFVSLDDRILITAEIADRLRKAGAILPHMPDMPGKARDLGPQTFAPAPGSDGDTRDWGDVQ
jgi:hypothetical protein